MAAFAGLEPEERQRIARQRLRDAMRTLMGVSERASGDPDEVMQWVASVDGVALQAASELDEARRASGGGIHLAGHGTLDPGAFASQLRAMTSSVENPFERQPGGRNARRTLRIIADVRAQLEHALRDVPEEATALTRGYLPAVEAIQGLRVATTIASVSDLAAWDVPEWVTFLTPLGAPDDLPGADETARVQFYAEAMNRIIEERYPTQVLARRIERDAPSGTDGVYQFLDANPSFDIRTTVIPMYLEANPGAMPGGVDPGQTEANLKSVQRLWALTPPHNHYDVTAVLVTAGLRSATEIASMGRDAFVEEYATVLDGTHPTHDGTKLASLIHAKAVMKSASTVTSAIAHLPAFNSTPIAAIEAPSNSLAGDGAATLTELFGSLDYCGCEHCRSVLSPAAYLVDLLALLELGPRGPSRPSRT